MSGLADDPVRAPETCTEDDLLLHRLRSGDEQAFGGLVRTWSPAMLRMARGFVSTDASAQECVQDAWLGVIKGLASFEGRSTLRTWAFRILLNIAKTRAVREQRTTPLSSLAAGDEDGPAVDPGRFRPRDDPERPGTWTSAGEPRPWETDPETGALSGELRDDLEGALGDERRNAFEAHLSTCDGCRVYVEQMRETRERLGHVPPDPAGDLPEVARQELLAAFRAENPH